MNKKLQNVWKSIYSPHAEYSAVNWFWLRRAPPQAKFSSSLPPGPG